MATYSISTEADRLYALFEHGDITLDEIVQRAISDVIEHWLRTLSFTDGSDLVLPYPWAEAA